MNEDYSLARICGGIVCSIPFANHEIYLKCYWLYRQTATSFSMQVEDLLQIHANATELNQNSNLNRNHTWQMTNELYLFFSLNFDQLQKIHHVTHRINLKCIFMSLMFNKVISFRVIDWIDRTNDPNMRLYASNERPLRTSKNLCFKWYAYKFSAMVVVVVDFIMTVFCWCWFCCFVFASCRVCLNNFWAIDWSSFHYAKIVSYCFLVPL